MIRALSRVIPMSIKRNIYSFVYDLVSAASRYRRVTRDMDPFTEDIVGKYIPALLLQYEKRLSQIESDLIKLKSKS